MEASSKTFGPVLYAEGETGGLASYAVLFYAPEPPDLACPQAEKIFSPARLAQFGAGFFWRCGLLVRQAAEAQAVEYRLNGKPFVFHVPALGNAGGFRIAYASCNGSEADRPASAPYPGRNALWEHMRRTHGENPFHILVQGGDQIYADGVWQEVPFLREWKKLPRRRRYSAVMPDEARRAVRDFYFACYMHQWSQPHVREALASIPSLMIWDDHDIFDGWGSWSRREQASPVYQGIFAARGKLFTSFSAAPGRPKAHCRRASPSPMAILLSSRRTCAAKERDGG